MILQNIVLKAPEEKAMPLYYKSKQEKENKNDGIVLDENEILDLRTYFNIFSCAKWRKYTEINTVTLTLDFKGELNIQIWHLNAGKKYSKVMEIFHTQNERGKKAVCEIPVFKEGALGLVICARSQETVFYGGCFETEKEPTRSIQIGIGICTFRREEFVARNMEIIKNEILCNSNSQVSGHLKICISDNAGTLDKNNIENAYIKIVKNKNLGGVGGFTRTIIEHLDAGNVSHILLMDDDAVISPESLERTYALLSFVSEKYYDYTIGGALLRLDRPLIQYENGADWNDGEIVAHNHDFDLSFLEYVLKNEEEILTEYTGWWYSCIPVSFINREGLPLPLFIHRDDIEYGLRAKTNFIFMNGICVWHEAFENKFPGFLEYYDVRNLAIVNAIHNPGYTANDFKKMLFIQVSSNIGKYRYKYVDLNLKGAVDFLKGFDWFYQLDTLQNHELLKKYNYDVEKAENYIGFQNLKKEDLIPDMDKEEQIPGKWEKIWKIATLNGHFFPAEKTRIKVVRPNPNIYELYRKNEVLFADNTGKILYVKRNRKELIEAYIKLFKVFRLIDKRYDKVSKTYRTGFSKMSDRKFWDCYLELDKYGKDRTNGN